MPSTYTTSEWWRQSVSRDAIPREPDNPQPGYYRVKLAKGGPWVAMRIWYDPAGLHCRVGDDNADAYKHWPYAQPISIEAWQALEAVRKEDHRFARWRSPIDLSEEPSKP